MNRQAIKGRARELLSQNKNGMTRVMLFIGLIGLIPDVFSDRLRVLQVLASILLICMSQGNVVSGLKMVTNRSNEVNDQDALTGIQRFQELFSTYFIQNLYIFIFVIIPAILLVIGVMADATVEYANYSSTSFNFNAHFAHPLLAVVLLALLIGGIVLAVRAALSVFAMGYLLEEFHIKTTQALKESKKLMKGHLGELFMFQLSYFGWYLLTAIITGIVAGISGLLLGKWLGTLCGAAVGVVFAAYTFEPELQIGLAIFYKELAYRFYARDDQGHEETPTMTPDAQAAPVETAPESQAETPAEAAPESQQETPASPTSGEELTQPEQLDNDNTEKHEDQ